MSATDVGESGGSPPAKPFRRWWTRQDEELIGWCALRFDGAKYETRPGTNPAGQMYEGLRLLHAKHFSRSLDLPDNLLDCFAVFFYLQRGIKWTNDLAPRDWALYHRLFLHLHDKRVPEEFQLESSFDSYQSRFASRARAVADRLRPKLEKRLAEFTGGDAGTSME